MFKVLYSPFPQMIEGVPSEASSVLIYESRKRVQVFCANIARDPDTRERIHLRFEITAEAINFLRSFQFTRAMIDAIYYTNTQGAQHRSLMLHSRKMAFANRDYPGQGGSGVDGYW